MNSGLRSSGGRGSTVGIERRDEVERGQQTRDEHAHRALVGRQLDVEIREAEQPDERGDRRRRADQRRVPGLAPSACRSGTCARARRRRAAPSPVRPMRGSRHAKCIEIRGRGRRVEDEGEPGAWRSSGRVGPVVALPGARRQPGRFTRTTTRRHAPLRIGLLRRVGDRVLARRAPPRSARRSSAARARRSGRTPGRRSPATAAAARTPLP